MPTSVPADEEWYARQSSKHHVSLHCPLAANDKCPRYFGSQRHAASAGVVTLELSPETVTRLEKQWELSDVFSSMDHTTGIWQKRDGTLRGVDGFCPEVTARIFGLYCSALRTYPDEDATIQSHKALVKAQVDKTDPRWQWMVVEPKHFCECHEFSVYGSLQKPAARKAKGRKGTLSPKLRFKVLSRDEYRCVYCGVTGQESPLQVDHKVSVAEGGTDDIHNLVTACEKCNSGKGSKSVADLLTVKPTQSP